jgi:hypothetical protein
VSVKFARETNRLGLGPIWLKKTSTFEIERLRLTELAGPCEITNLGGPVPCGEFPTWFVR